MASSHLSLISSSAEHSSFDSAYLNDSDKMFDDHDDTARWFDLLTNDSWYKLDHPIQQEHVDPQSQDAITSQASNLLDDRLEGVSEAPVWELGDLGENGSSNFQRIHQKPSRSPSELSSGTESSSSDEARLTPLTPIAPMPPTPKLAPMQAPVDGFNIKSTGFPFQVLPETPPVMTPLPSPVLHGQSGFMGISQPFHPDQVSTFFSPAPAGAPPMPPSSVAVPMTYPEPVYVASMPSPPISATPNQTVNQLQKVAVSALEAAPVAAPAVPTVVLTVAVPKAALALPHVAPPTIPSVADSVAPPVAAPQETVSNKRSFMFVENIVPENFVANPNNHGRWEYDNSGNRHYLNAPKVKKQRVSQN